MSRVKVFSLNDKRYYCCADFGKGDSVAVAVISKNNGDGTSKVVATKVLGKSADFGKEEIKSMIEKTKKLQGGIIMAKLQFKGNGESTRNIAIAFNQLCDDLENLGEMEVSYWAMHLRGNKAMLKSRAKQIVMRAKILQEMINCYAE